jgi:xylulokinase
VKLVTTDLQGRRRGEASLRYPTSTSGTGAEQDASTWWDAVTKLSPEVITAGDTVAAIAVTSQAPTLVPVDASGNPTMNALTWLDRRAKVEAERIAALAPTSRNGADPFFGTAKLPWLAHHRPDALENARYVLSANGFIVHKLTGVAVLDETTASLMQGFDETTNQFHERLMADEPTMSLLAPIVSPTKIVGYVTAEAAAATGITAGAPVAAGGIDAIGSALEAGVVAIGDPLVDMTGFSSVTILVVPRGTYVPGFMHSRHCVPGLDLLMTAQVTAGATIDWVNGLDTSTDLRLDLAIHTRPRPGRIIMVPSLAGERTPSWDTHARGIIDGIDLATDPTDLMLAAMEGNAFAMAADVVTLRNQGLVIDNVICTGGGSTSPAWMQIKSDVLGVPITNPSSGHGAAQGAAALAGVAIGVHESFDAVKSLAATVEARYSPDLQLTDAYADAAARFTEVRQLNATRQTP